MRRHTQTEWHFCRLLIRREISGLLRTQVTFSLLDWVWIVLMLLIYVWKCFSFHRNQESQWKVRFFSLQMPNLMNFFGSITSTAYSSIISGIHRWQIVIYDWPIVFLWKLWPFAIVCSRNCLFPFFTLKIKWRSLRLIVFCPMKHARIIKPIEKKKHTLKKMENLEQ